MLAENLLEELKTIIPQERIKEKDRKSDPLGNSGKITVLPVTEEEISAVLAYANEQGKKIVIEGGGTKRGFGGVEEEGDILLSMAEFKGVVEHTAGDMTLTVKAGTTFNELQDFLLDYEQQISLDPPLREQATIGGIVSANESGPKRLGYGSSRDAVIGLRMIYPDGTIIRAGGKVVKNVAGYDMNKLFIGAMGTLGVITEVTVKLRPIAKYESLILLSFEEQDLEKIRAFSKELLDSSIEPVVCELLNPSLSKKLIGEEQYTLAVSFEDVESSVHYQEEFVKKMKPDGAKLKLLSGMDAQDFWRIFSAIAPNGNEEESFEEAAVKIGAVNLTIVDIIKESRQLSSSFSVSAEAHGGLGHGISSVYLKGESKELLKAITHLRKTAESLGGYAIVKHLPLALRKEIEVWGKKPAYFFLLEGIKKKIDPKRTLNPKRYVGGL
ncbi:FAD-binding oxidoreductase [Jeotgalibacillus proteolyticus]|uniref:FAD-binding oxidoreductase n=1 Tax=Jeotgalibacillus proteolyticus TaxID=2082395 RepID=UPI003CC8A7AC